MSLPGADLLLNKIKEIELAGRAYRGEPSKEDMELARRAVDMSKAMIPTMIEYLDNEWAEGDGLPGPSYRRKYGVDPQIVNRIDTGICASCGNTRPEHTLEEWRYCTRPHWSTQK